jgi:hypothetical protein
MSVPPPDFKLCEYRWISVHNLVSINFLAISVEFMNEVFMAFFRGEGGKVRGPFLLPLFCQIPRCCIPWGSLF